MDFTVPLGLPLLAKAALGAVLLVAAAAGTGVWYVVRRLWQPRVRRGPAVR